MRIAEWAKAFLDHPGLAEVAAFLRPEPSKTNAGQVGAELRSLAYEARPALLASSLAGRTPARHLIVTASYERALQWHAKLSICGVSTDDIVLLPSGTSALFEDAAPEHIALSDRLGALRRLALPIPEGQGPLVVITTPQAALERTLPRDVLETALIELHPGDTLDLEAFKTSLELLGYEHQEPVRQPGGYSRRGGILDVYPTGRNTPVRIELFGDEIESIRMFDPNTQRSVGSVAHLSLSPSRETLYQPGNTDYGELVRETIEREAASLDHEAAERLEELIGHDADALTQRVYFDRLDLYRPLLHPESGCVLDLLTEGDALYLDEPLELEAITARSEDELRQALKARHDRGEILDGVVGDFLLPPEHLGSHLENQEGPAVFSFSAMNALPDWLKFPRSVEVGALSLEPYRGRAEHFAQTLKNYQTEGFQIVLSTDQPSRAATVLRNAEFPVTEDPAETDKAILVAQGNLGGGFVKPEAKFALISDAELFGVARLKLPQKRFMEGAPVATVLDLKPGDYVVHIHFGIGIFRGLIKRMEQGVEKEFLFIEYAPPDKLFVPADQLDRIQKYLNPGDENPKLNRLTGGEWQRTLGKAKEEAKEFARDLVRLYAERKAVQRRPFGPDTPWQHEMEATFPYVETPSQMQAIRDAKLDLEVGYPMDRLVCGDVGFGKTEVAIRVAFKVAQSGRQVAVLCPTTILSEQHFRNFHERLDPFGTRLALINRFTHTADRAETLRRLKAGDVEIVIGTHALLGAGIEFKDLSLVIIDEEQKFGVKQKEMLKKLRTQVDVLTLSATPIPRTLSMALMDIRQLSLINDPPPGRLPIRSFLRPYAGEVVREAILRELARGGQVFYVYNRVESIHHVAERIRKLVPHARIGIGHGQMGEKELEPIMVGFIKGEIDILLSTTIIENGIDISNANTLIVENADRLGLAQLYQLRGRVGRSDRQAYAYFLYDSAKDLSENALARLQALQEFSSLGSGYSLAFRDLQIRGAGELLGAKQHGAMAAVGYELYTQLINEAVAALKNSVDAAPGEGPAQVEDPLESLEPLPSFDLPIPALLPDAFIHDQAQRLYYYQRMMGARTEIRLGEVQAEVEDRYGHPMPEVRNAFAVMSLRIRAKRLGFAKLEAKGGRISVGFSRREEISPRVFSILGKRNREAYLTRETFIWPFTADPLRATERLIEEFSSATDQVERELESLGV
jgi:transcription-repair coupling factor (superfamily II helicase)